jgi:methylmalonyl-CoA mutase
MSSYYQEEKNYWQGFSKQAKKDWIKQAESDLSGKDFEKILLGKVIEGIRVYPFYTKEDIPEKNLYNSSFSDTRFGPAWEYQELLSLEKCRNEQEINQLAMKALEGGVEALLFDCSSVPFESINFDKLLEGILRDAVSISWKFNPDWYPKEEAIFNSTHGVIYLNPIENYMYSSYDYQGGMDHLCQLLKMSWPSMKALSVDGSKFYNSGASAVQELGLTAALLVEYLHQLTDKGLDADLLMQQLEISLSTRSAFFVDLAKFRAMPLLIRQIAEAYQIKLKSSPPVRAVGAIYNKAAYDTYSNLLRNTSEAMAAVMGNCRTVCLLPHDGEYACDNLFARRMSRNISHLLKYESYMDMVHDPLAGAYGLESLTSELAEKAWDYFQRIESEGGLLQAFQKEVIHKDLRENTAVDLEHFRSLKKTMVGANRYVPRQTAPVQDQHFTRIDLQEHNPPLLQEIRLAAVTEGIRHLLDKEEDRGHSRPMVGLINCSKSSKAAVINARRAFVEDILASVGMKTIYLEESFLDLSPDAIIKLEADALVVLGDDDDYEQMVAQSVKDRSDSYGRPLVLAGYAKPIAQQMHLYGFHSIIYLGMDVPRFAENLLQELNFFSL